MAHGLIKWALKKQTGLNEPGKREEANLWAVCRKARIGHNKPKVMYSKESKGLMKGLSVPRMKCKVIGLGKPKES